MADAPPLLAPGIHTITEADLAVLAVTAYPASQRRSMLFGMLQHWLNELRTHGLSGRCWIDGSFLTEKLEPNDIDLLLFPNHALSVQVTPAVQAAIGSLLDKPLVKAQFSLDLYLVHPLDPNFATQTSYWRGWYGFCRDGATAKGIAEVIV